MFDDFDEMADEVRNEGIAVLTLQELRDSLEYRKLGPRVLAEISTRLAGEGLGYFPRKTIEENDQPRQWEEVRVYAKNSAVGKIVDAVLEPGPANDTFLLEVSSQDDAKAAEILDQIRTLIEP